MTIQTIPLAPIGTRLSTDATLRDALREMLANGANHLPVCDAEGRFVGMVRSYDLLAELLPASARIEGGLADLTFAGDAAQLIADNLRTLDRATVAAVAREEVTALAQECPLLEAMLVLSKAGTPLPVVDAEGRVLGMLSARQLLAFLTGGAGTVPRGE